MSISSKDTSPFTQTFGTVNSQHQHNGEPPGRPYVYPVTTRSSFWEPRVALSGSQDSSVPEVFYMSQDKEMADTVDRFRHQVQLCSLMQRGSAVPN